MALSIVSCGGSDSSSNSEEKGLDIGKAREEARKSIEG